MRELTKRQLEAIEWAVQEKNSREGMSCLYLALTTMLLVAIIFGGPELLEFIRQAWLAFLAGPP